MKKLILFATFFISSLTSNSQQTDYDTKDFDVLIIDNTYVIGMNMRNPYFALRMTNARFIQLMQKYGYLITEGGNYMAQNLRGGTYTIKKEAGMISMIWALDAAFPSKLKDQVQDSFTGYENGYAVYKMIDPDDKSYGLLIWLSDNGQNGWMTIQRVKIK